MIEKKLNSFEDTCRKLYFYEDESGRDCALLSKRYFDFVSQHFEQIQAALKYERDFNYDYFGFKTLERSYLLRVTKKDLFLVSLASW